MIHTYIFRQNKLCSFEKWSFQTKSIHQMRNTNLLPSKTEETRFKDKILHATAIFHRLLCNLDIEIQYNAKFYHCFNH